MMARRTFGSGVLGGLAMLALGGCKLLGLSWTYRYRITVEVDTPQGLKSGFAVREIVYTEQMIKLPDAAAVTATQRGEAVVVDLPNGQALFALLSTNGYETLQAAFGDDSPATLDAAQNDGRVVELRPKPNSIPEQSGYPTLVTFTDIADPASVKLVVPNELADSFGPGVRLKRITVEITDDPVTTGIEERLGWLLTHRGTLKPDPPRFTSDPSDPDLRLLDTGPFSTERHQ
jgi:hypothetical protein